MKPSQILLPAATGILGLLLGLALAPVILKPGNEILPDTASGPSQYPNSVDPKTNLRTRAKERVEDRQPKKPGITIPLENLASILRGDDFVSSFDRLNSSAETALVQLGVTRKEREKISKLFEQSKVEILELERTHLKLGKVTAKEIQIDQSGMRGPAQEIIGRIKVGIQSGLPADLAECFLAVINWDKYYPTDNGIRFEITRNQSGELTAFETFGSEANVIEINSDGQFKNNGTPLPADRIFSDRWKPHLKGMAILPKDEE